MTDFYINISFEAFNIIMGHDKKLRLILSKNNFEDRNLESLNCFEALEHILHLMSYKIINVIINYNFFDTNVSKMSFVLSLLGFKYLKPALMFCEMPVKYANRRIKSNKRNIGEFLMCQFSFANKCS
ncbi:MAG: hypothetical protein LBR09_01235 [Endomicrobium sp.]|nr:hypothetical protein [Endomicrobium sp.]